MSCLVFPVFKELYCSISQQYKRSKNNKGTPFLIRFQFFNNMLDGKSLGNGRIIKKFWMR